MQNTASPNELPCHGLDPTLELYLDGELGPLEQAEFEQHLQGCYVCAQRAKFEQQVRTQLKSACSDEAPQDLRNNIISALEPPEEHSRRPIPWVALATAALLIIVAAGWMFSSPLAAVNPNQLVGDITAQSRHAHTRQVIAESLSWHQRRSPLEVTSTQRQDVGVWFEGKVDFPVRIPAISEADVVGARIANIGSRPAALVSLKAQERNLSMMIFLDELRPQVRRQTLTLRSQAGYSIAVIENGPMTYSIVSDLPKPTLKRLVRNVHLHD